MIRIVIADDHTIMREGLKRILDGALDIEIVGEAINGFEVLSLVRQGGFDLLLLDLSMPGRSGVDLIRQVRSEAPKLAILILTMHEEEQYAVRAIRAGAQGYLTKESAGTQLVGAIRKVASGRPYISTEVAEQLALNIMAPNEQLLHKQLVGPRIRSVFAAGGRQVDHRDRQQPAPVGQDRQHPQDPHHAEDGHDLAVRNGAVRRRASPAGAHEGLKQRWPARPGRLDIRLQQKAICALPPRDGRWPANCFLHALPRRKPRSVRIFLQA
jgi:DNA-binding NarL/FixJ family response regulator